MTQLEKGLPPNNVGPQLKYKVERMKEKVRQADIISEPDADVLVLFQEKKSQSNLCVSTTGQMVQWSVVVRRDTRCLLSGRQTKAKMLIPSACRQQAGFPGTNYHTH